MKIKSQKDIEKQFDLLRTLLAITIALAIAFVIILFISETPLAAIKSFVLGPVENFRRIGNILEMMTPLLFTGVAVSLIFSSNQTNMAVEGAFFVGAVGATIIATTMHLPIGIHLVLALCMGGVFGAVTCYIPAKLYVKYDSKPVVSSLMMNYVCLYLGLYVINNLIRDHNAGFLASHRFDETAKLVNIFSGTKVHLGLIIGIIVVIVGYLFLYKSKYGYQIRMVGKNVDFSKYSGIPVNSVITKTAIIGGFIAGLGGAVEVLGMYNRFQYQGLTNHGFDGILVGIMAKFNPKYVPLAALFLAYVRVGADVMSRNNDIPIELVTIIQAIIIMLVVAERFLYNIKHKKIVQASQMALKEELINE